MVGTHALIEDDVVLNDLGLVVVDEQHRFGVAQRQRLRLKARAMPNFLAMTATPIPRSLALTVYGDVDVIELREMPPGRLPVETRVVTPDERDEAYDFVRGQVSAGRQVFVICPLIEESDKLGVRSVTAEHRKLEREVFPDPVSYTHLDVYKRQARGQRLLRLGIATVSDLLLHLPRRYEDTRSLVPLRELRPGLVQTSRVRVREVRAHPSPQRRMPLVEASLEDGSTRVGAIWFNQPYLANQLHAGMEILVSGKVISGLHGLTFQNPRFERASLDPQHVGRLAAVYPETDGVTSKYLRALIGRVFPVTELMPDRLPPEVREAEALMPMGEALRQVHLLSLIHI